MAHIHEKVDFTAEVFIVYKDKVLLKRHQKFGGIWLSIGGHVELDEDPNQAAIREVKEEVGLDVILDDGHQQFKGTEDNYVELIPPIGLAKHRVNETHEHVILIYFAKSTGDAVVLENPTDEFVWASIEDLKTMDLIPNVRYYAQAALDTLAS